MQTCTPYSLASRTTCLSWSKHNVDWVLTIRICKKIVTSQEVLHPNKSRPLGSPENVLAGIQKTRGPNIHLLVRVIINANKKVKVVAVLNFVVRTRISNRLTKFPVELHKSCML